MQDVKREAPLESINLDKIVQILGKLAPAAPDAKDVHEKQRAYIKNVISTAKQNSDRFDPVHTGGIDTR